MISLSQVYFSFGKTPILSGITLDIEKNEFIGIIGPNGGGKTTFLQLVMGFLHPQVGSVLIDGSPTRNKLNMIGLVPQKHYFDASFPISTLDVTLMGDLRSLNNWGRYPKYIVKKAQSLLERFGLSEFASAPFGSLSGGQMQKVLIARALIGDPKILILDEPTANIDPEGEASINQLLLELKHKMTILLVTHETPGILPEVDRILCINKQASFVEKKQVCSHVSMGLYHHKG